MPMENRKLSDQLYSSVSGFFGSWVSVYALLTDKWWCCQ